MWFFIADFNTERFSNGNRRFLIEIAEFLDRTKGTKLGLDTNGFFCGICRKTDITKFIQHLKLMEVFPFEIYFFNQMYEKAHKESFICRPIS